MFTGPNRTTDGLVLSMDALNYKSYKRDYNILDYSTWTLGTGSVPGFSRNGSDIENHRVLDTDPWGNEIIVWEARPEGDNSGDGGWNGSRFPIDNTKTYRFSTWMRRTVNTDPSSFYLGTQGYGSVGGVKHYSSGSINTNPYFTAGSWSEPDGEWVLIVGHIHPHTTSLGTLHPDSGMFTIEGGKIRSIGDYIWLPETTESLHRSNAYYITDTTTRQQWCYPRVDVIDGTEPSIHELLNAKLHRWKDLYGKNQLDVIDAKWNSEGYFSFRGQGTNDSLILGDRISGFGGVADTRLYPEGMTLSWWMRISESQPSGQCLFFGGTTINFISITNESSTGPDFRTEAKLQNGYAFGPSNIPGGSLVGRWVKFDIVFDFTTSPRSVRWYQNGELIYTKEDFDSGTGGSDEYFSFTDFGRANGNPTYKYQNSFKGDLAKLDIYGKPLNNNQIKRNYNAFKNRFGI